MHFQSRIVLFSVVFVVVLAMLFGESDQHKDSRRASAPKHTFEVMTADKQSESQMVWPKTHGFRKHKTNSGDWEEILSIVTSKESVWRNIVKALRRHRAANTSVVLRHDSNSHERKPQHDSHHKRHRKQRRHHSHHHSHM